MRSSIRPESMISVTLSLLALGTALGAPGDSPRPRSLSTVGIVKFRGSNEAAVAAHDILRELLTAYEYHPRWIDDFEDAESLFKKQEQLEYAIRGIVANDTVSALIFSPDAPVRRVESSGPQAAQEVASKVLRHISSESSLKWVVKLRKASAAKKLEVDPSDVDSLAVLGLALRLEERHDEAIASFERALAIRPHDPDLHYHLALCLASADKSESVVASLRKALELDPNHEAASLMLANTYLQVERIPEAIATYRQLLKSPLHSGQARWNLGVAYLKLKDERQALEHFQQIAPSDFNYGPAQVEITRLLSNLEAAKRVAPVPVPVAGAVAVSQPEQTRGTAFYYVAIPVVCTVVLLAGLAWARRKFARHPNNSLESATTAQTAAPAEAVLPTKGVQQDLTPNVHDAHRTLAPPVDGLQSGRAFRDYELLERLGGGGMGTVYRARHLHLHKVVALKVLRENTMFDSRAVERFRREMRAVGQLDHPNIVRATDAGEADGVHFLVMEFVPGLDLAALLQGRGRLQIADACELIRQAAVGLQYAHTAGIVHRDVKPSNLILSTSGTVKVLDLGLARLQEREPGSGELTFSTDCLGTPDFMSPEQANGSDQVNRQADIYSLGCTFYMLLTGQAPYAHHSTVLAKIQAHVNEAIVPANQLRPDLPAGLVVILNRMLEKEPTARFGEAREVVAALTPLAQGSRLLELIAATPNLHTVDTTEISRS